MAKPEELVFAPLGGVGEIGMNLSIYGLGNRQQRAWLAIDLGVSFGDEEHLPGIDLIMPDISFPGEGTQEPDGPGANPRP
ncbi:mRNA degradation ribonuclease J1/J2 [Bradyrhizobium sp. LM3.2]